MPPMEPLNMAADEKKARFKELQAQLRDRWQSIEQFNRGDVDILVVPSLSLNSRELQKVQGFHHYEERNLYSLIRLRNPRTRLIYITSHSLHPSIIDYYLQLLPGIPFSHARERLLIFCTYDDSTKSLTEMVLDRPRLISRIRQALRLDRSYMVCYNSTPLERELSVQLGVPLLALDPDLLYWGTKSGSREIFAESEVPHPDGSPLVWTMDDLAEAAAELWQRNPQLQRIVVKLNEGFSGEGNALLDLRPLPDVTGTERVNAIRNSFPQMRFQSTEETWENFGSLIQELGAIVEAFVEGDQKRSPSVQCRITANREVEIISTHDQILGGPDGQIFLGCKFPADEAYQQQLQEFGRVIGENLKDKGAMERFGVDFMAVQQPDGDWDLQAIEINLRKGGTTHPLMTLKYLTNGRYDRATGLFYSKQARPKYYIATDNLQKEQYRGLLPNDLMDIIAYHQLHFDTSTETGTVFHLMGCLSQYGKLGLTSIGNSPKQAQEIYDKVVAAIDAETNPNSDYDWSVDPTLPMTWGYRL